MHDYKEGRIEGEDFWRFAIDEWNINSTMEELIALLVRGYERNSQAIKLIRAVRDKGIKTIICSNNYRERIETKTKKMKSIENKLLKLKDQVSKKDAILSKKTKVLNNKMKVVSKKEKLLKKYKQQKKEAMSMVKVLKAERRDFKREIKHISSQTKRVAGKEKKLITLKKTLYAREQRFFERMRKMRAFSRELSHKQKALAKKTADKTPRKALLKISIPKRKDKIVPLPKLNFSA